MVHEVRCFMLVRGPTPSPVGPLARLPSIEAHAVTPALTLVATNPQKKDLRLSASINQSHRQAASPGDGRKAIRTDSHDKYSDSFWRRFRCDKIYWVAGLNTRLRVAKRLSVAVKDLSERVRALAR